MRLNTLLVVLVIGLGGCACKQVPIRVEKMPEPPVISRPELKLDKLGPTSAPNEVVEAYYEAVLKLSATLEEALNALSVYRSK